MKKFIMALVAIVCFQSIQMNGAWAAAKAAGSFLGDALGSKAALTTSVACLAYNQNVSNSLMTQVSDKANIVLQYFGSPKIQALAGIEQLNQTWYSKGWNKFLAVDESMGVFIRWIGYCGAIMQLINIMNASEQKQGVQQPQVVKQPKRPAIK